MARWQDLPDELVLPILVEALNQPSKKIPVYEPTPETTAEAIEDIASKLHRLALGWTTRTLINQETSLLKLKRRELHLIHEQKTSMVTMIDDHNRFTQRKISELFVNFGTAGSLRLVNKKMRALVLEAVESHMEMLRRERSAMLTEYERQKKAIENRIFSPPAIDHQFLDQQETACYQTGIRCAEAAFGHKIALYTFKGPEARFRGQSKLFQHRDRPSPSGHFIKVRGA